MGLSPTEIRDVYADVVDGFRSGQDPTFEEPDLRYTDLPGGDLVRYDDHEHVMRVDPAEAEDDAVLRGAFAGGFTDAYERVLQDAIDDISVALDGSPVSVRDVDYTVEFETLDGEYTAAINPSAADVILDEEHRRHIDLAAGEVTDMLRGQLRQQMAHVALHHDGLYDEPGLLPYWLYIEDGSPVLNEHGARNAFDEAVHAFQENYDADFDPPDLSIVEEPYSWDRKDETITLDARTMSELNHDALTDEFIFTFKTFYDEALLEGLDQAIDWLSTLYKLDEDIQIDEAFFKDLGDGTAANYNRSNNRVRIHEKFMDRFDLETGRFEATKPDSSRVHEVEHGRDYQLNPHTATWKSNRPSKKEVYGESREYKEDIRNATLEMKTTFVQWLYGRTNGRQAAHRAIEDPWHMPDFFDGYLDIYGPRDTDTIRDPYRFGLFTARSILRGFVNEHGPDDGLDLMLDYLQSVTTTPEGLQGALERSLDMRDVPNYPRMLDMFHTAFDAAGPDDHGIDTIASQLDQQLDASASADEHLDPYLQASALVEGFETAYPDADMPDAVDRLSDRVDTIRDEYVDEELEAGEHPEWLEDALNERFS